MRIRVLGALATDDVADSLSRRDRLVLAALATSPGTVVGVDQLAEALWRDDPPASASKVVQGCVVRLRRALGSTVIETAAPGYRLVLPSDALDTDCFESAVERARALITMGQADRAAYVLDGALDLWRGRPFAELEDWQPAAAEAVRLDEVRQLAEELRVEAGLLSGRPEEVLARAAALVTHDPLREHRWALLVRAQYALGQQGDALRSLREARHTLVHRLGVDPGRELVELEQAVLHQEIDLIPSRPGSVDGPCPYRGLAAYDVEDADDFFGRDEDLTVCLRLLEERRALTVAGPSGIGKSSLVRAGIAAVLRERGDRVVVLTPAQRSLHRLGSLGPEDVLVVDQLEELFTPPITGTTMVADSAPRTPEDAEREGFAAALQEHHQRGGRVVLAVRSDRLSQLAGHRELTRLIESGLHLLGPIDEPALRAVIEEPARQRGLLVEPGLVDLLVREVAGEPGAMPMLSHALRETWLRREGSTLTVAGYRASGGIRGAVAQTAERLYAELSDVQRDRLRSAMLRLVVPSADGVPLRARVPRHQLDAEPSEVLDRLVAARLVTSEADDLEIAHESLTMAWPRLRGWLDDDVEGQRILHHLSGAAHAWVALGRPDSELYRGIRLTRTEEWCRTAEPRLTEDEHDFLAASRGLAEVEEASLAARAVQQSVMIRRLRGALGAGAVMLALALVATVVAVQQRTDAVNSERAAGAAEREAEAGRLGALALTVADPVVALLLAVEGVSIAETADTRSAVFAALERRPGLVASASTPGRQRLNRVAASPDGRWFAAHSIENEIHLFDVRSHAHVASADLDGPDVTRPSWFPSAPLAFSPDSQTLAVGTGIWSDDPVTLLDVPSLQARRPLTGLPPLAKVVDVAYSADGSHLAASFLYLAPGAVPGGQPDIPGGELRIWDLDHPARTPASIPLEPPPNWDRIQLDADGSRIFTGGPPRAFDIVGGRGRLVWQRDRPATEGGPIALSADGRWLVTPHESGAVVRDARSGREVARFGSLASLAVAISTDGSMVASTEDDGVVRVWRRSDGLKLAEFDEGGVGGIAFSPDGRHVYSVGGRREVHVWDVTGSERVVERTDVRLDEPLGSLPWVDASPTGAHAALLMEGPAGGRVILVESGSGRQVQAGDVGDPGALGVGTWRTDGTAYLAGDVDGGVTVVPLEGRVQSRPGLFRDGVAALASLPDGRLLAADESGRILLVDAELEGVEQVGRLEERPTAITSHDGREALVLTTGRPVGPAEYTADGSWARLDLTDGSTISSGRLPGDTTELWYDVDSSPDARRYALVGARGAWFLDRRTGEFATTPVPVHRSAETGQFSADGSHFVSVGNDGTIAVWDPGTGLVESTVRLPPEQQDPALVGPDRVVVIGSNTVRTWHLGLKAAVDAACAAAGRSLTQAEWRQYVGRGDYRETC